MINSRGKRVAREAVFFNSKKKLLLATNASQKEL